jgi:GntR family transcriptional repressor for pyruvate dehydrogenase complex
MDAMESDPMSEPNLRQVKPVRLFDQVVELLQTLIAEGTWEPGDRLPSEAELGATYGVSRSVVREALRVLESKGLIEVRAGAGAFVATPHASFRAASEAIDWLASHRDSLRQLLQVRESVEGLTASLAASSVPEDVLSELQDIVRQQRQLAQFHSNLDAQVELDVRFHTLIAQVSGNAIAEEIIGRIVPAFCDSNRAVLYLRASMDHTLREHQAIVEALASGDPMRAEQAMRSHVARVRGDIESLRQASGAPAAEGADQGERP